MSSMLQIIASKLYNGDNEKIGGLVQQALDQGIAVEKILNDALIAGMDKVSKNFKSGDLFLPEVLVSARAMYAGMDVLQPLLWKCLLFLVLLG